VTRVAGLPSCTIVPLGRPRGREKRPGAGEAGLNQPADLERLVNALGVNVALSYRAWREGAQLG
jgi:hypothetical protein